MFKETRGNKQEIQELKKSGQSGPSPYGIEQGLTGPPDSEHAGQSPVLQGLSKMSAKAFNQKPEVGRTVYSQEDKDREWRRIIEQGKHKRTISTTSLEDGNLSRPRENPYLKSLDEMGVDEIFEQIYGKKKNEDTSTVTHTILGESLQEESGVIDIEKINNTQDVTRTILDTSSLKIDNDILEAMADFVKDPEISHEIHEGKELEYALQHFYNSKYFKQLDQKEKDHFLNNFCITSDNTLAYTISNSTVENNKEKPIIHPTYSSSSTSSQPDYTSVTEAITTLREQHGIYPYKKLDIQDTQGQGAQGKYQSFTVSQLIEKGYTIQNVLDLNQRRDRGIDITKSITTLREQHRIYPHKKLNAQDGQGKYHLLTVHQLVKQGYTIQEIVDLNSNQEMLDLNLNQNKESRK